MKQDEATVNTQLITAKQPLLMEIVHYPHPTLRHVSKPLKRVDAELHAIVRQMFELMYENNGVGLAANQVDLPYRLFITNIEGDPEVQEAEQVYINPVLSGAKGNTEAEEGCLSIPNVYGQVNRAETITVTAYNLLGQMIEVNLDAFSARVVQHETDHLDGKLFIDRLSPAAQLDVRQALEEFEIEFGSRREQGEIPDDQQITARLGELEKLRT